MAVRETGGAVGRPRYASVDDGARASHTALDAAWNDTRFSIIEVPLAPGDISPVLARFVAAFKKKVY